VVGIDPSRLYATLFPNLASVSKLVFPQEQAFTVIDETLGLAARLKGLSGVSVVVNCFGNGGSFLALAKSKGIRIVTDFISHPLHWDIVAAERERWNGWEEARSSHVDAAFYRSRIGRLVALSDIYLCPSNAVGSALSKVPGFDAKRVRIVPYGASGGIIKPSKAVRGRVLFAASSVSVAKGLPYLAEAASILRSRKHKIEIVVAGSASQTLRERPEVNALTFLGQLDQNSMTGEFARADVFCLPSLAEGSAVSIYEALASGVPVVTTPSSGSVVTDGVEGFIVPERDGPAIAHAIERIVTDRPLRDAMSKAARQTAERCSDRVCGDQFIAVIRELLDPAGALAPSGNAECGSWRP
jgi:glycosyltransferase involved in cell wall biosynthesis